MLCRKHTDWQSFLEWGRRNIPSFKKRGWSHPAGELVVILALTPCTWRTWTNRSELKPSPPVSLSSFYLSLAWQVTHDKAATSSPYIPRAGQSALNGENSAFCLKLTTHLTLAVPRGSRPDRQGQGFTLRPGGRLEGQALGTGQDRMGIQDRYTAFHLGLKTKDNFLFSKLGEVLFSL